eukprot:jgi/Bigna1/138803/aug1.46_g13511
MLLCNRRHGRRNLPLLFIVLAFLLCAPSTLAAKKKKSVGNKNKNSNDVPAQGMSAEKLKRREARDARKMAAKKRRKELRRKERQLRLAERVREKKKEKKKAKAGKIKPLNAKGLKAAKSKLSNMHKRSEADANGIVHLDSREYKRYINDGPRGYYTMVVYTALDEEFQCSICQSMNKEMIKLSQAMNLSKLDPPVFIASVDYKDNAHVFQTLQFRHVPIVVLVPPTNTTRKPKLMDFYRKIPQQYRLMSTGRLAAQDFANFIAKNAPAVGELNIPQPTPKVYKYVGLSIVIIAVLYLLVSSLIFKNICKYQEYKLPYFTLVLVFYAWCAGALNLSVGLMLVLLNSWALDIVMMIMIMDKNQPKYGILRKIFKFCFSLIFNPWVIMAVAVYIWWQLLGIYSRKNPSYNYGAIPEHELFDSAEFYKKR